MKQALTQIQDATNAAANAFRPAIGQRHYAACVPKLYDLILKCEHAMLELQNAVGEELSKQEEKQQEEESSDIMFGVDMRCVENTTKTIGVFSEGTEIRHVNNCSCKNKPLPSLAGFATEMGKALLPPVTKKRK